MADRRRIITLSPGGRPVLDLDLEVTSTYQAIKDTFAYQPGQQNPQSSREPGRYGGDQVVGEDNDNGTVSWQALVRGTTVSQVAQNIEALLLAGAKTTRARLLEWRPEGATFSSYWRIAGPITWKPTLSWSQLTGAQSMVVEVSVPVRPLVLWDPMTIVDPFDADSRGDYTFDGGTSADVSTGSASLNAVVGAALTSERRARHTIRGYPLLEGQATVVSVPGVTITGYKAGVVLRGSAPDTYVEVYVDDNGVNSRLRVDVVVAGVRTNRQSTNLAARIVNNTAFWVRGRIEGQTVYAEHFTAAPMLQAAATTATPNYTLTGGEQTSLVAGHTGWSWVAQHVNAFISQFSSEPYTRRLVPLPAVMALSDAVPGSAPALADAIVAMDAASVVANWAIIGWSKHPKGAHNAVAVLDSAAATSATLASSAQANTLGGTDLRTTTIPPGGGAFGASWALDFKDVQGDEFTELVDLEVWARVLVSVGHVNPRARASLQQASGLNQNALEFGLTGRPVLKPNAGSVYQEMRLGVIAVEPTFALALLVEMLLDAGSAGAVGVDYAWLVPARRRACGVTGVSSDTVPIFASNGSTKTIRSDLSGDLRATPTQRGADSGLGGSMIQLAPGLTDLLVKTADFVPDDPRLPAISGTALATATVRLDVTPRSYMLRS